MKNAVSTENLKVILAWVDGALEALDATPSASSLPIGIWLALQQRHLRKTVGEREQGISNRSGHAAEDPP